MGFYGKNTASVSQTQLSFDRTYANRTDMDNAASIDGIYIGRLVLIDYDCPASYRAYIREEDIEKESPQKVSLYVLSECTDGKELTWTATQVDMGSLISSHTISTGMYVYVEDADGDRTIYKCVNEAEPEDEDDIVEGKTYSEEGDIAQFIKVVESSVNAYHLNYTKDRDNSNYAQESTYDTDYFKRGWDSTVWQKTYTNNKVKYVQIAELNGVVPTIGLSADAPTITPLTPHFDEQFQNGVYYKLHTQPQWGVRVKALGSYLSEVPMLDNDGNLIPDEIDEDTHEILSYKMVGVSALQRNENGSLIDSAGYPVNAKGQRIDSNGNPLSGVDNVEGAYPPVAVDSDLTTIPYSDVSTFWTKMKYDTKENKTQVQYYNPMTKSWDDTKTSANLFPAAIFFNKNGFNREINNHTNPIEPTYSNNYIQIRPSGLSGKQYNTHNTDNNQEPQADVQELSMYLPGIGDAVAEIYNDLYGKGEEDASHRLVRNTNMEWNNYQGLRLITFGADGYTLHDGYNETENDFVENGTLAGAVNTLHDFIGMNIVTDREAPEKDADYANFSKQKIYYYDKKFWYKDTNINLTDSESLLQNNIDKVNITSDSYDIILRLEKVDTLQEFDSAANDYFTYDELNKNYQWVTSRAYDNAQDYYKIDFTGKTDHIIPASSLYDYTPYTYWYKALGTPNDFTVATQADLKLIRDDRKFYSLNKDKIFQVRTNQKPASDGETDYRKRRWYIPGYYYKKNVSGTGDDAVTTYTKCRDAWSVAKQEDYLYELDPDNFEEKEVYSYNSTTGVYESTIAYIYTGKDETEIPVKTNLNNWIAYEANKYYYYKTGSSISEMGDVCTNPNDSSIVCINYHLETASPNDNALKERLFGKTDGGEWKYVYVSFGNDAATELGTTDAFYRADKYWYQPNITVTPTNPVSDKTYVKDQSVKIVTGRTYYMLDKDVVSHLTGFFEPNKYYYIKSDINDNPLYASDSRFSNSTYGGKPTDEEADEFHDNWTYYKAFDYYVYSDSNSVLPKYYKWNTDITTVPSTIELRIGKEQPTMKELEGFARTSNTATGLILNINRLCEFNNKQTRDLETVQGALNTVNDFISRNTNIVPGSMIIIDEYGRLHGGEIETDTWIDTAIDDSSRSLTDHPTLTITHANANTTAHTTVNNETPAFGSTFTITDLDFDSKGHKANSGSHTVTIPKGSLTQTTAKTNGNVLTSISFVDTTGAITVDRTNLGALQLGSYTQPTGGTIEANTPLSNALSTLETRIYNEENTRAQAISDLTTTAANNLANAINALNATLSQDAGADGLALKIVEENGKITSISGSIKAGIYDTHGSSETVKSQLLGTTSDTKDLITLYGIKAWAKDYADTINTNLTSAIETAKNEAISEANTYADGLATNYDRVGSAATAEQNAKDYAYSLADNYDVAGAAATAEQNAKDYTDEQLALLGTECQEAIDDKLDSSAVTGDLLTHNASEFADATIFTPCTSTTPGTYVLKCRVDTVDGDPDQAYSYTYEWVLETT